jgi:tripartite-type tricarboxylate transporter receptor subunit TctC
MRLHRFALAIGLALAASPAWSQSYPDHPIRVIVPFSPGGSVDVLARLLGGKLSDQLGKPIVVENRPGAGGTLASDYVAKSAPDGYTILQNTIGAAIAPAFYKTLPFDAYKDFAPVTQLVGSSLIVVASVKSGITSMKELIDRARANPSKLNYGSTGVGNPLHLTMEMIKQSTGVDIVAVPFRGDAQINAALLGGEIEVAVVPLATAVPLIQGGRIRGLAITGSKRSATVPEVPTVAETVVPGFASSSWHAWFMPAKTPAPIVARIQKEVVKALAELDVRARLTAMALDPVGSTPEEFTAFYKNEIAKFTKVIADAKIPRQ